MNTNLMTSAETTQMNITAPHVIPTFTQESKDSPSPSGRGSSPDLLYGDPRDLHILAIHRTS